MVLMIWDNANHIRKCGSIYMPPEIPIYVPWSRVARVETREAAELCSSRKRISTRRSAEEVNPTGRRGDWGGDEAERYIEGG